jgi:hypothetical protein
MYDVGYTDIQTYRDVFKKNTGINIIKSHVGDVFGLTTDRIGIKLFQNNR